LQRKVWLFFVVTPIYLVSFFFCVTPDNGVLQQCFSQGKITVFLDEAKNIPARQSIARRREVQSSQILYFPSARHAIAHLCSMKIYQVDIGICRFRLSAIPRQKKMGQVEIAMVDA